MYKKLMSLLICIAIAVVCFGCANTLPPEGLVTTDGATEASPTTDPVTDAPFADEPVTDAPVTEGSVTEAPPITDEVPKISEDEFIEGLKDIFANAKTVEELNAAVTAFDTEKRVKNMRVQQYRKGPIMSEGELVDDVVAIVYFDDGLWVECVYPGTLLSSKEYELYEAGTLSTVLKKILDDSNTYGELLAAIEEYDVYGWIKKVEVYESYDMNGAPITDKNAVLGRGHTIMRVEYGTSSWMQIPKTNSQDPKG